MTNLFILIFGLVLGSFLNVVINRLNQKKNFLFGRSFCPHCQAQIRWFDNIPLISFFLLGRRCRNCHKEISWQYPAVEAATAVLTFWLYLNFGLTSQFFTHLIFTSSLIIIFVYDLKHYLILDQVSLPAMVVALLANLYLGADFFNLVIGAVIGGGFFALQFFLSQGKWVGGGDIRLGALMGLMLGWKFLLVALFLAYVIGGIFGVILVVKRKKTMSSQVPFGPFLAVATFLTFIYGEKMLVWYLNFLNY